jgi:hypothetical protein
MLKHSVVALAVGSLISMGSLAQARETGVVGTITKVEPNRLELRTASQESTSVTLTADTTYLKWVMAKPWQQDLRTDMRFLKAGKRVHIDVLPGAGSVAKTVWIVTGRPGLD